MEKFKTGDIIKHKASKELALVIGYLPEHTEPMGLLNSSITIEESYLLSIGIEKKYKKYHKDECELTFELEK